MSSCISSPSHSLALELSNILKSEKRYALKTKYISFPSFLAKSFNCTRARVKRDFITKKICLFQNRNLHFGLTVKSLWNHATPTQYGLVKLTYFHHFLERTWGVLIIDIHNYHASSSSCNIIIIIIIIIMQQALPLTRMFP